MVVAILAALLIVGAVALVVWAGGEREKVPSYGPSMQPTVTGDQAISVDESAYDDADPQIGDIVIVQGPAEIRSGTCAVSHPQGSACPQTGDDYEAIRLLKRIVAGPSDRVAFAPDGSIIRNGERVEEDYIRPCPVSCALPVAITVPEDHYFVAGDNRGRSSDSRDWGAVSRESIDGRVQLVE